MDKSTPTYIPSALLDALSRKTIVFVHSTGRCGTGTLSKIVEMCPDTTSIHEDRRHKLGDVRVRTRGNPEALYHWLINSKLPDIANDPNPVYFTSSHLIGKVLFEQLVRLGVEFNTIFLHRDPREVCVSMYYLDDIPGVTKTGNMWYMDPVEDECVIPLTLEEVEDAKKFELCFWYTQEMLERSRIWSEIFSTKPAYHTVHLNFRQLKNYNAITHTLTQVGIPISTLAENSFNNLVSVKYNDKIARKWTLRIRGYVGSLQLEQDEYANYFNVYGNKPRNVDYITRLRRL